MALNEGADALEVAVALRPMAASDLPFLLRVYASTRVEELAGVPWTAEQKAAFITQQFEAQHAHYQQHYARGSFNVVLLAGEPVGRLYLCAFGDEIRIVDIALLPEFRHVGVGSVLLHRVLADATEKGLAVRIHVERNNPALAWYEANGFRLVEDRGVYLFMEHPAPVR